ncbi:MAG: fluoride efflux transporter CrcB [Actinomycetota bacterium]
MTIAGIVVAGAAGALARYGMTVLIGRSAAGSFPWATLFVNVSGSLVLGFLAAVFSDRLVPDAALRTALTVGFLGAYTTFSTFSLETFRLLQDGAASTALGYMLASVFAGLLAVYVGWVVGRAV